MIVVQQTFLDIIHVYAAILFFQLQHVCRIHACLILAAELFQHFVDAQIVEVHGDTGIGFHKGFAHRFVTTGAAVQVQHTALGQSGLVQFFHRFRFVQAVVLGPFCIRQSGGAGQQHAGCQ